MIQTSDNKLFELENAEKNAFSRRKFVKGCLTFAGCMTFKSDLSAKSVNKRDVAEAKNALEPGYVALERSGELQQREQRLWAQLERCNLCPRSCGVNRLRGNQGRCSSAETFKVSSHGPHFGEEAPFVGRRGSGTIFFSNCNLLCNFCQNWQTNHRGDGRQTNHAALARMMIALQRRGCHNINLVTPTHLIPHIVRAIRLAVADGLRLPLLYNTSGYDSVEVIQLLDGIVDIYLPDFKFQDAEIAAKIADGATDYPKHTAAAIKEMHRQVGTLRIVDGVAQRGILIRHLVLPENIAGTDNFVKWTASELGTDTHINIMSQYAPQYRAHEFPPLSRRLNREEMAQAMRWAQEAGLRNFH